MEGGWELEEVERWGWDGGGGGGRGGKGKGEGDGEGGCRGGWVGVLEGEEEGEGGKGEGGNEGEIMDVGRKRHLGRQFWMCLIIPSVELKHAIICPG